MSNDPVRAFIGIGGNTGDLQVTLAEALWAVDSLPQTSIRSQSRYYQSPPWGRTDQPDFINAVVEVQTRLAPRVLLDYLLEIEERFGRVRSEGEKWGPRDIDLDLLTFGDQELDQPGMHVPHPHLHERAFVLLPLAEIAPRLQIPGHGQVSDLLAAVDWSAVQAID